MRVDVDDGADGEGGGEQIVVQPEIGVAEEHHEPVIVLQQEIDVPADAEDAAEDAAEEQPEAIN